MELISDMLLVVHVPKTAGTSFRQALEKYFGLAQVVRDYGPNAPATSEVVMDCLYRNDEKKQMHELVQKISSNSAKVLIGHFAVNKYGHFFKPENIISFVRDPLERTCSEYRHRMNNATYEGSFSEFITEPGIVNIQSRFLRSAPGNSFIGLTEQYRESLKYINYFFQSRLSALKRNVDKNGGGRNLVPGLSKDELELFMELNEEDLALYKNAEQRFSSLEIPQTTDSRIFDWLKRKL